MDKQLATGDFLQHCLPAVSTCHYCLPPFLYTVNWNLFAREFFANVQNCKKYNCKTFSWLYSDYSCDGLSQKCLNRKNFAVKVSWHFRKYFPAQYSSSLQYRISVYSMISPCYGSIFSWYCHDFQLRKANKLAELMEQMNLSSEGDNSMTSLPDLPSYSLLGNMQTVGSGNLSQKPVISPTAEEQPSLAPPAATNEDLPATSDSNDQATSDQTQETPATTDPTP